MWTQTSARVISCALVAILAIGSAGNIAAQENPTRIVLSDLALTPGEAGMVEGRIECSAADGCSAFAVEIVFDPAIIQVDEVEIGPYLGESLIVAENVVDNTTGVVRLAVTAIGELGAADDPVLFRLHITALAEGLSALDIIELEIGDLAGNGLPAVGIAGAVVVSGSSSASPGLSPCELADVDGSGAVNIFDIRIVARLYGHALGDTDFNANYDFDGDGQIGILDLFRVASQYGRTCE